MTPRLEREGAEENRSNWLEHWDRMYRTHVGIAQEWAQKSGPILCRKVSTRLATPYARDSAGRRISMPGNATQSRRLAWLHEYSEDLEEPERAHAASDRAKPDREKLDSERKIMQAQHRSRCAIGRLSMGNWVVWI